MSDGRFMQNPAKQPVNDLAEAYAHPETYTGACILFTLDTLRPTPTDWNFDQLDQAWQAIVAYNAKYPNRPLTNNKLRMVAGEAHTPGWALAGSGGGFQVFASGNGAEKQTSAATFIIPQFWTEAMSVIDTETQNALAGRYDGHPLLNSVAITSCSIKTAEVTSSPRSPQNDPLMLAAGYTDDQLTARLLNVWADYAAWKLCCLDLSLTGFPGITTTFDENQQIMQAMATGFRSAVGDRAILANHGLQPETEQGTQLEGDAAREFIASLGGSIAYQPYSPSDPLVATCQNGVKLGMTQFEVWDSTDAAGGFASFTQEDLDACAAMLAQPSDA
jgi:hypothetical protein